MVAGFQDDLDSEDEAVTKTTRPAIAQDIDLSSEDEDNAIPSVQVVEYNEDYASSEDVESHGKVKINNTQLDISDNEVSETKSKPKMKSVSSGSELDLNSSKEDVKSAIKDDVDASEAISNADNLEISGGSDKSKTRKVSSDSSSSDHMTSTDNCNKAGVKVTNEKSVVSNHMTKSANGNKSNKALTNEDSDSESDDGCHVTVLQDTDINPEDFGGEDVFNDWLNKQEQVCV